MQFDSKPLRPGAKEEAERRARAEEEGGSPMRTLAHDGDRQALVGPAAREESSPMPLEESPPTPPAKRARCQARGLQEEPWPMASPASRDIGRSPGLCGPRGESGFP